MTLHLSPEELAARAKAQRKAWRLDHPDRMREFYRKHAAKPEVKIRKLQWARDNKDTINAQRRAKYWTAKMKYDELCALALANIK